MHPCERPRLCAREAFPRPATREGGGTGETPLRCLVGYLSHGRPQILVWALAAVAPSAIRALISPLAYCPSSEIVIWNPPLGSAPYPLSEGSSAQ